MMANYLLGGGGSSRLWKRIREKRGAVATTCAAGIELEQRRGQFAVASRLRSSRRRTAPKVETAFSDEMARALKDGFTAQELAEGQRGLLSRRRLQRAQDASVVARWRTTCTSDARSRRCAQVDAALEKLTLDDVNAALRKYLKPDQWVWAFAGEFNKP